MAQPLPWLDMVYNIAYTKSTPGLQLVYTLSTQPNFKTYHDLCCVCNLCHPISVTNHAAARNLPAINSVAEFPDSIKKYVSALVKHTETTVRLNLSTLALYLKRCFADTMDDAQAMPELPIKWKLFF